ncbi:MAG: MarC family protein [Gammaproteobacteria bacterium]|jgi:multiple antibiotic resistance protein|nr:MarC family protein [Gammaproteobacteria bacterium]MBT4145954.1 MarC family protein [Gammaproteobacteria bacterium]MBT5223652.1 MarC family protein [Gammaproteobacteria bacterium]MBT5824567.1 MarC family protein [Gammaproteobacteria bacterium]MBT5966260.1 MarC family protein [Gammaproteobacteria bacterium]
MWQLILTDLVGLWVVIDPIGTIPVFISVTKNLSAKQRRNTAFKAVAFAALILMFFLSVGQILLETLEISLLSFQITGGIILFLFALSMIFGDSKPQQEEQLELEAGVDCAVFPLAMPSIASPGAMLAVVVLTENNRYDIYSQMVTASAMMIVLLATLLLLLSAGWILRIIGKSGAGIVSRVMGLILATVATEYILSGLKLYFQST